VLRKTAEVSPALRRVEEISARNFLEDLLRLKEKAEHWLQVAEKEKNAPAVVLMMKEVRANIETLVKLALMQGQLESEIAGNRAVSLLNNPEWLRVQACIMQALGPFPEARVNVVSALTELKGKADDPGFEEISPSVLQIINREFGEDEEPEEDRRPPAIVEAEKASRPKIPAPTPAVEPAKKPSGGLQPTRRRM